VAVIMVTGEDDPKLAEAALGNGAYGYVIKPFRSSELLINVSNALRRRRLEGENAEYRRLLEQTVDERTGALRRAIDRLQDSEKALRESREETIRRLAAAVEQRDGETARHIERMSRYCSLLARRAGLPPERVEAVRLASPMHDVGKIATPAGTSRSPASTRPKSST
jgi:putative two-component system response regulator